MGKQLTQEEFINKAKAVHGERYDYSKVVYTRTKDKVTIICPVHGPFQQTPGNHLNGKGCPKCYGNIKLSLKEVIDRFIKIHGNKYDYSKFVYKNNNTLGIIICPEHGPFLQLPVAHWQGQGCAKCYHKSKRKTTEQFIKDAKQIHGNYYDYSEVNYIHNYGEVTIICPKHGRFKQIPHSHLQGKGCKECAIFNSKLSQTEFIKRCKKIHNNYYTYNNLHYISLRDNVIITCPVHGDFKQLAGNHIRGYGCSKCNTRGSLLTLNDFIKKSKEKHGNFYDYSKSFYNDSEELIEIICPMHGSFWQLANNHMAGCGCPKCVGKNKTTKEYIKEAQEIHGDKYIYTNVNYKTAKGLIEIICPKHGSFKQKACAHLWGQGCPECAKTISRSSGEIELCNYIRSLYSGKILENDRTVIKPKELDIYLPELKLALEYNGEYWHQIAEQREPGYHENKQKACIDKGIKLIEIWENEWKNNKEEIKLSIQEEIKKAESN